MGRGWQATSHDEVGRWECSRRDGSRKRFETIDYLHEYVGNNTLLETLVNISDKEIE